MMILKYAFVGLVLIAGINANAQEKENADDPKVNTETKKDKTPAEKADKKVASLTAELGLTETQAAEVKELILQTMERIDAIKNDAAINDGDKKSKIKAQKDQFQTSLIAKLDATQKEKLEALKATKAEKLAALNEEMTTLLSLTPEQVEKVTALNLKVADKIQVIKNNDEMDKAKKKEFIKGNKGDHKNTMSAILTADQFVIYEAWLAEKKADHDDDETH